VAAGQSGGPRENAPRGSAQQFRSRGIAAPADARCPAVTHVVCESLSGWLRRLGHRHRNPRARLPPPERSDRRCSAGHDPAGADAPFGAQRPRRAGVRALPHVNPAVAATRLLALCARGRVTALDPPPAGAGGENQIGRDRRCLPVTTFCGSAQQFRSWGIAAPADARCPAVTHVVCESLSGWLRRLGHRHRNPRPFVDCQSSPSQ
jgi:hypothetical protein